MPSTSHHTHTCTCMATMHMSLWKSLLTSHMSAMPIGVFLPWGIVDRVVSKLSTTLKLGMGQVNPTATIDMIHHHIVTLAAFSHSQPQVNLGNFVSCMWPTTSMSQYLRVNNIGVNTFTSCEWDDNDKDRNRTKVEVADSITEVSRPVIKIQYLDHISQSIAR